VGGRVQGVFFRASTREQAVRLGVTGYARNLPDGQVEVLVCGDPQAVGQLKDWLRVVATNKNTYELKYFNINQDDDVEADDE
jgi:acylphosphatase